MTSVSLDQPLPGGRTLLAGRWGGFAYLAAGAVATGVYFAVGPTAQAVLYGLIGLSAVAAIYVGAVRRPGGYGVAWQCFAAGLLLEVAGDSVSSGWELGFGHEPPLPSVADALYLGGYPLLAIGIYLLLRARGGKRTLPNVLDALIVFVGVATVQWIYLVAPYTDFTPDTTSQIVSMAYPCLDVLLLVGFAQLLVAIDVRSASCRLLLASVGFWVAGDEIYALTTGTYAAGQWIDAFWLASYVAWGGAALVRTDADERFRDRRAVPRLSVPRLAMLGLGLVAVPVAFLVEELIGREEHVYAASVGGILLGVLVLARVAGLVHTVDRARLDERRARWEAELAGRRVEAQNAELRELDRLKDDFVSSVSHELRTPLTSIAGYVELLVEEVDDPEARRHLDVVQRNSTRLLALVSDLLFAARLQAGRLELRTEPVDLRGVVEHALTSARPPADAARVSLRLHADDVPAVAGERDRLAQLVDNLVSNAIKFTPAGGAIDVTLARSNGSVRLEVADDGIGMSDEERARLFERFFRSPAALERQIPGTGLGLHITKAIVDAHGGTIAAGTTAGGGTTFVVELPVG